MIPSSLTAARLLRARPSSVQPSPSPRVALRGIVERRLGRVAAALGLERVDGRWTVPALASYFDDAPPSPDGVPRS